MGEGNSAHSSLPSGSRMMVNCGKPEGCGAGISVMAEMRPDVGACCGAETAPWLRAIIWPFLTRSPSATSGFGGRADMLLQRNVQGDGKRHGNDGFLAGPAPCGIRGECRHVPGKVSFSVFLTTIYSFGGRRHAVFRPVLWILMHMLPLSGFRPMPSTHRHRNGAHHDGLRGADGDTFGATVARFSNDRVHQLVGTQNGIGRAFSDAACTTDAKFLYDEGMFGRLFFVFGEIGGNAQFLGQRLDHCLAAGRAQRLSAPRPLPAPPPPGRSRHSRTGRTANRAAWPSVLLPADFPPRQEILLPRRVCYPE